MINFLDLSDPVCTKVPTSNIYSRINLLTSPSAKSSKTASSNRNSSSITSPPIGGKSQKLNNTICDNKKGQLFYLENYANQHLKQSDLKLGTKDSTTKDTNLSKDDTVNGASSEKSSIDENDFDVEEDEEEHSEAEIKVEDD